jgi:hypothetical protein
MHRGMQAMCWGECCGVKGVKGSMLGCARPVKGLLEGFGSPTGQCSADQETQ